MILGLMIGVFEDVENRFEDLGVNAENGMEGDYTWRLL